MPPKRKLPADVIADFRKWIEMGAPDPRVTNIAQIKSSITEDDIKQAKESFWAYKRPTQQHPPMVQDTSWPKNDIDHFILAKLDSAGLQPAEDADAHKVVRRLCFDLVVLTATSRSTDRPLKVVRLYLSCKAERCQSRKKSTSRNWREPRWGSRVRIFEIS